MQRRVRESLKLAAKIDMGHDTDAAELIPAEFYRQYVANDLTTGEITKTAEDEILKLRGWSRETLTDEQKATLKQGSLDRAKAEIWRRYHAAGGRYLRLTREVFARFLEQAKGDRLCAKELAHKAGYATLYEMIAEKERL